MEAPGAGRAWDLSQGCCATAQLIITNNDKTGATKTFMALAEPPFGLSGRGLPHAWTNYREPHRSVCRVRTFHHQLEHS